MLHVLIASTVCALTCHSLAKQPMLHTARAQAMPSCDAASAHRSVQPAGSSCRTNAEEHIVSLQGCIGQTPLQNLAASLTACAAAVAPALPDGLDVATAVGGRRLRQEHIVPSQLVMGGQPLLSVQGQSPAAAAASEAEASAELQPSGERQASAALAASPELQALAELQGPAEQLQQGTEPADSDLDSGVEAGSGRALAAPFEQQQRQQQQVRPGTGSRRAGRGGLTHRSNRKPGEGGFATIRTTHVAHQRRLL